MKKGLMVVFEGTDGSGKTTIIDNLPRFLGERFGSGEIVYYHWRPGFIKSPNRESNENTGKVCTDPHGKKPYGRLVSLGKFLYFNLDYILGYWFEVRRHLAAGKLVIFDRYYYDYYLDKQRYRLNISDTVLNFFLPLIPRPAITFLLHGDAQTLYERKREIPVGEIQRQLDCMMANRSRFPNAVVIDVNREIGCVTRAVADEIRRASEEKCG